MKSFKKLEQYRRDIFMKMNMDLKKGKKILDVGCGDGQDAEIFIKVYGLNSSAVDIYKDKRIPKIKGLKFKKGSILELPYNENEFDYVFMQNVLHHVDEKKHSRKKLIIALKELKRVCKNNGNIFILEANRYNPLFYPHMVKMGKHEHLKQKYIKEIIGEVFDTYEIKHFESHLYPSRLIILFKFYEKIMESIIPKQFLAYNFVKIINDK